MRCVKKNLRWRFFSIEVCRPVPQALRGVVKHESLGFAKALSCRPDQKSSKYRVFCLINGSEASLGSICRTAEGHRLTPCCYHQKALKRLNRLSAFSLVYFIVHCGFALKFFIGIRFRRNDSQLPYRNYSYFSFASAHSTKLTNSSMSLRFLSRSLSPSLA